MFEDHNQQIEIKYETDKYTDLDIYNKFKPDPEDNLNDERLSCFSFMLLVIAMIIYRIFAICY